MLLENFPGRTLEELDDIDWGRFMRAKEAQSIRNTEELRLLYMANKADKDKITTDDWASFKEHVELLEQYAEP